MVERLHRRQAELDAERRISALPPQLKGAALVIPAGLLARRLPPAGPAPEAFAESATARAAIEAAAMEAVMAAETRLGHAPRDVSADKKGWDIESRDGATGHLRFLEVKGRHVDGDVVILTKNEVLAALNAPEAFILAIVRIADGGARDPVYIRHPPFREPGFGECHVALKIADLLSLGASPA